MPQVYDAGLGDVIEIPGHWPARVTVTGWENTGDSVVVHLVRDDRRPVPGHLDRRHRAGTTTMSDATLITMVAEAPADHPLRVQYQADIEAACAALLDTVEGGQPS